MGARNGFDRLRKCGFKTEALVKVLDVIVNCFWYANHTFAEIAPMDFRDQSGSAFKRTIASDHKKNIYP